MRIWTIGLTLMAILAMAGAVMAQDKPAEVTTPAATTTTPATVKPAAIDPANCIWSMVLDKAIKIDDAGKVTEKPISVYFSTVDAKAAVAFCNATAYNKGTHQIDASGLKVTDGIVTGTLKITINPDAWVPSDKKSVAGEYVITATAKDDVVTGTFTGKYGTTETTGAITGKLVSKRQVENVKVTLNLENALTECENYISRGIVNYDITKGKAGAAKIAATIKNKWTGKVTTMSLVLTADTLTGDLVVDVKSKTYTKSVGKYTYTFDGKVLGSLVFGSIKRKLGDTELKDLGTFTGILE